MNSEFTQKTMRITNNRGIITLATRSMPFSIPRLITMKLSTRKIIVHPTQRHGLATSEVNMSLYS